MVSPEEVVHIYKQLTNNAIPVWVVGGWGIDALLGEHIRPHKDLDILVLLDDVVRVQAILESYGYKLAYLWTENRMAIDTQGNQVATAFILQDAEGHELDIHALRLDEMGNAFPLFEFTEGFFFSKADLAGVGIIAGVAVQCISPEKQFQVHVGYELPATHLRDLELLREKFG
jgi:lincosamide nucleotidyltransferase A/C/D/E